MINYFHSQSRRHHSYTKSSQAVINYPTHQHSAAPSPCLTSSWSYVFYIFVVYICVNESVHLCHHLGQLCLFSKGGRSANSDEGLWSSSSWKQPRHNQHPCLELRYVKVRLFHHFHPAKIRRAARKYESCRCSALRLKRA